MIIKARTGDVVRIGGMIRVEVCKIETGEVRLGLAVAPGTEVMQGGSRPDLSTEDGDAPLDLERALDKLRWELIDEALRLARGNKSQAALLLGLKRTTLVETLKRRNPQPERR